MSLSNLRERLTALGPFVWDDTDLDYVAAGFSREDIDDFLVFLSEECRNMTEDETWSTFDQAAHALRALGQLGDARAIPGVLRLLQQSPEGDDFLFEEVPKVMPGFGSAALDPLAAFMLQERNGLWAKVAASDAVHAIGSQHGELRQKAIVILHRSLTWFSSQEPTFNGLLIANLVDLMAVESIDLIREVFAADAVDLSIQGDLEEVEFLLGLRERRAMRQPKGGWFNLPQLQPARRQSTKIGRNDLCPCGSGAKYKRCCLMRQG